MHLCCMDYGCDVFDIHCKSHRFTDSQYESIDADYLFHSYFIHWYCFQENNKYSFLFLFQIYLTYIYFLSAVAFTKFPFFSIIFVIQEISFVLYIIWTTDNVRSRTIGFIGNHSIRVLSTASIQTNLSISHMELLNYSWITYFQHILP